MNQKEKLIEATIKALTGKLIESEDSEVENFVKQCEDSGRFDDYQIDKIKKGFEDGLTIEQIKTYADPKIDWDKMMIMEWGFVNGLTIEQIKFYFNPQFNYNQMLIIKQGFEDGLTTEQIKSYTDLKYNSFHMKAIKEGLLNGLTIEQTTFYADSKFSTKLMKRIKQRFEAGDTIDEVIKAFGLDDYINNNYINNSIIPILIKYGFVRCSDEDYVDNHIYKVRVTTDWPTAKVFRISEYPELKITYIKKNNEHTLQAIYEPKTNGTDNLDYAVYTELPHYKDVTEKIYKEAHITENDIKQFYDDCILYAKECEKISNSNR